MKPLTRVETREMTRALAEKWDKLSIDDKRAALEHLIAAEDNALHNKFYSFYPDEGPLRRELYKQHAAFFELGETHQIRAFLAGNRVGKTEGGGGYEMTAHLTGRYPEWWQGARFTEGVRAWAAGDTRQTTKEIIQQKLLGDWGKFGTGMIPRSDILSYTSMPGVPEAVGTLRVQHYDHKGEKDGQSRLVFKSYDQGRVAFQGTEQEVIWLDEESDDGIRGECILRLMTTNGLLIETLTPLMGLTPLIAQYLPAGYEEGMARVVTGNKALVMAGWDDVPHLAEADKQTMREETPPHLIEARSKGIPSLGSGAIYPLAEAEFLVDDMPIPDHWPRAYALDVGWNKTAALWGALDPASKVVYLYAEHYRGKAEPAIHAAAIKAKGSWIPGVIDPASSGAGQKDGKKLKELYGTGSEGQGLDLTFARNDVEAGLAAVWQGLSQGGIKVFRSLQNWRMEYRMYHRDEKGAIVKQTDHLMDDTRYLILSGMKRAKTQVEKRITFVRPGQRDGTGL